MNNQATEHALLLRMGEEEKARVSRATRAAISDRALARRAAIEARNTERARCLAIARLWPENHMAREIARRIIEC